MSGVTSRIVAVVLTGVALLSCTGRGGYRSMAGGVWNTSYSIKYCSDRDLSDSVLAVMRDVEMSLSPFNEGSLISRINRNEVCDVDGMIEDVFELSVCVNRLSGGAFDPTLSPVINLWGFGYVGRGGDDYVPADSAIAAVMGCVGIDDCEICEGKLRKKCDDTTFNFSAVTKGYGCDLIGAMLARNGVENYMVEIGGELALSGVNERGELWSVMIDAPVEAVAGHRRLTVVSLSDVGMATSGNYRNYRDTDAGRVGHTISAVTGRPVVTDVLSATVIAPGCGLADALATACMAMDECDAMRMIEGCDGCECLLVMRAGEGMRVEVSSGFAAVAGGGGVVD